MNKTVAVKDTRIIFRNLSGKERKNNEEGERTFCVVLDDLTAAQMIKDKWNVFFISGIQDEDKPTPYVKVSINQSRFFPSIIVINGGDRKILNDDTVSSLDKKRIKSADVTMNGYSWVVGNRRGVKVYLEELILTIEEN